MQCMDAAQAWCRSGNWKGLAKPHFNIAPIIMLRFAFNNRGEQRCRFALVTRQGIAIVGKGQAYKPPPSQPALHGTEYGAVIEFPRRPGSRERNRPIAVGTRQRF